MHLRSSSRRDWALTAVLKSCPTSGGWDVEEKTEESESWARELGLGMGMLGMPSMSAAFCDMRGELELQ